MSFAPSPLIALGRYWIRQGGAMLGIVGDATHTVGYHLGRDRIYDGAGPGRGDDDYSVKHPRDKYGLSNAAAAIDLGRLDGRYSELYAFSTWLVEQCMAKADGTQDIREVIYSPDGERVQRYSGIDGQIHTGPGNGDSSHRFHTHVSYFRDSETRDKVAVFAAYWEDDMAQPTITNTTPLLIDIAAGAQLYAVDAVTPVTVNKIVRTGVFSPYGSYKLRCFALDIDGAGDTPRSLYFVEPASTAPLPGAPVTAPAVLTSEDGAVVYNRV
jgi:hypothetical protein